MKLGLNLEQLAETLTAQLKAKRDFIAPSPALGVVVDDAQQTKLEVDGIGTFEIGEVAHEQLADRNDIPRKYYQRMLAHSPGLLASNVNHWLSTARDSRFLVRNLGSKTRAVLSDRYRPFDNAELAEIAVPQLIEAGARIESCEVTERRFYLKAVTEKLSFEVGPKQGDVVQAGIVISNSEVGDGRLSVEPLLFRLVCLNGMIASDKSFKRSHLGGALAAEKGVEEYFRDATREQADRLFWMQVRDVIAAFFDRSSFERIVERFRAARADTVTGDPIKVVEVAQKRFGLNDSERNVVLGSFLADGQMNRFGLVNAITFAAQHVPSYDRSTELERLGGQVLELSRRDWQSISEAE